MNKINRTVQYAGKLVLTFCLLISLFITTPAFALDYNSEAKNYLTSVQNNLSSIKAIIQKLPNTSLEIGQKNLAEVQAKLDTIQTNSQQKANFFKGLSNNYQIDYENKLKSISQLYELQKEKRKLLWEKRNEIWRKFGSSTLAYQPNSTQEAILFVEPKSFKKPELYYGVTVFFPDQNSSLKPSYSDIYLENDGLPGYYDAMLTLLRQYEDIYDSLTAINNLIKEYEADNRNFSNIIVLTDKVSVLADNLEKRINLAKQKTNNVKEYAEVLKSFSDPDILGEIKDLDQYIGQLTQNLPV
jgi:hypothetical protein